MAVQCNIIIDSCCDLPMSMIPSEGVYLLPYPFLMNDGDHLDDLWTSMESHDFYERLRKGEIVKTAQPQHAEIQAALDWVAETGVPTVFLSFTSGLSGAFDSISMACEAFSEAHPELELHLVNTMLASVAEGVLVYEAFRQRDAGMSAAELAAWAEEARWYVNAMFMVDDLEALRRGGRIPAGIAYAGAKLDVKPLLGFDCNGKLAVQGFARGRKKGIRAMAEMYAERATDMKLDTYVFTGNADCPKDAVRLADLLRKDRPNLNVVPAEIGPVIGSHVGPDMVALVFFGPDRRESISVADRIAKKIVGK